MLKTHGCCQKKLSRNSLHIFISSHLQLLAQTSFWWFVLQIQTKDVKMVLLKSRISSKLGCPLLFQYLSSTPIFLSVASSIFASLLSSYVFLFDSSFHFLLFPILKQSLFPVSCVKFTRELAPLPWTFQEEVITQPNSQCLAEVLSWLGLCLITGVKWECNCFHVWATHFFCLLHEF